MTVLKTVRNIELNEGNSQARGMFNLSNDKGDVSFWFDAETKDRLIKLDDANFYHQAKDIIKESNLD